MRAGFDRTPVVAGGQGHGVDAVENALVVRGGPVGIGHGKGIGMGDAFDHLLAGKVERAEGGSRDRDFGPGAALVASDC